MKMITVAAVVLGAVSAANAQVNFDRGVDAKSFAAQAAAQETGLPRAKFGIPQYSSRDCKKVEFGPESPLTSADITLRATETYQDCQNMGSPVGQICFPRTEWYTETTNVTVTAPRELKEGQKEVFEVCLWGQFLSLHQVQTVYKYKVKTTFKGIYITPQGPKAEKPLSFESCRLSFDMGRTCQYKCADGQTFTNFNPFPPVTPNQWVGPIYTPCPGSAVNPFPATKGNNMWQVLSKIKLNDKQADMNGTLVGLVSHDQKIDTVVKELNEAGFKAKPYQDNSGGYLVMAEVTPQEASDRALGLARYYYITEVLVGEKVYRDIFPEN
ncbi:MAG TPA: hypothetical protein PKI19_09525 [Elusimicrobiales bacterium]|nr:hypothetical protein [Elusimicrobiales bacterium]